MIEQTLVLVKPDGVFRGLIGEIIKRFELRGLKVIGMKMILLDKDFARKHYTDDIEQRHGKHVRESQVKFITEGPVVALCIEGHDSVKIVRKIIGTTYPDESPVGSIRGDFAHITKEYLKDKKNKGNACHNLVHASGNKEEAELETKLWFSEAELYQYPLAHERHIF